MPYLNVYFDPKYPYENLFMNSLEVSIIGIMIILFCIWYNNKRNMRKLK
jgi:hypothetical protein